MHVMVNELGVFYSGQVPLHGPLPSSFDFDEANDSSELVAAFEPEPRVIPPSRLDVRPNCRVTGVYVVVDCRVHVGCSGSGGGQAHQIIPRVVSVVLWRRFHVRNGVIAEEGGDIVRLVMRYGVLVVLLYLEVAAIAITDWAWRLHPPFLHRLLVRLALAPAVATVRDADRRCGLLHDYVVPDSGVDLVVGVHPGTDRSSLVVVEPEVEVAPGVAVHGHSRHVDAEGIVVVVPVNVFLLLGRCPFFDPQLEAKPESVPVCVQVALALAMHLCDAVEKHQDPSKQEAWTRK